ncbi:MAG: triose-phosphate isomerase, partial [Candidatus Aegiribacteria sp.]|nr:triose-phosphate isomerase [Candidatus Aegiribacteria sp.]
MKYIIGGNWKMNGLRRSGIRFLEEMEQLGGSNVAPDVLLFPPFTIISDMAERLEGTGIELGGQDLFYHEKGAFTGEVSPAMLRDAGATWF